MIPRVQGGEDPSLIAMDHFLQNIPISSGSFAENDLQLGARQVEGR